MMNKKIIENYGYNLLYQILLIIIPLITTPYISRALGAQALGTYSYVQAICSYFSLFGVLGITIYGQREIACVQNDVKKRSQIFAELFTLKFITMSMFIGLYVLLAFILEDYSKLLFVQGVELLAAVVDITWLAQGLEDFKKIVFRNILVKIISVILIFNYVKTPLDMMMYILCISGSSLLGNLFLWFSLNKYINVSDIVIKDIKIIGHLKSCFVYFVPQIAIQIYTLLDRVMLGSMSNNMSYLGYYDQSQKIIKLILACITALSVTMLPRITAVYAQKDFLQMKCLIKQSFKFVFFMAFPMTIGLILIAPNFVSWFFGCSFANIDILICALSPIIIISSISSVIGTQYLIPTKKIWLYNKSVICGAIANFFLNLLLIPKYYAYGAVFGTIIAETLVSAIQVYYVRKEFNVAFLWLGAKPYILAAFCMGICLMGIRSFLETGIITTFVEIFTGGIIYIFALFLQRKYSDKNML